MPRACAARPACDGSWDAVPVPAWLQILSFWSASQNEIFRLSRRRAGPLASGAFAISGDFGCYSSENDAGLFCCSTLPGRIAMRKAAVAILLMLPAWFCSTRVKPRFVHRRACPGSI